MGFGKQPPVRARLYCGKCGGLLAQLEVDPADPNHDARAVRPANPRRHRLVIDDERTGQVVATIAAGAGNVIDVRPRPPLERDAGRGFEYRPGLYLHRYRCQNCKADWQFKSDRLGAAILAKAAGRRGTVRLVAGADV